MNRETALALVNRERDRQIELWGSPAKDRHCLEDWSLVLTKHQGKLADAILSGDLERVEHKLVTIAAIAVAALESYYDV